MGQLTCIQNQYFNKKEPLEGLKMFQAKWVTHPPAEEN